MSSRDTKSQQQHRMSEDIKNEEKRGYYEQFNNSLSSIQKVGEFANPNDNLSKSAPSNSWKEEQTKPTTAATTTTMHKRGASSDAMNISSSLSSKVESMIRSLSLNEKESTEVNQSSGKSTTGNKHGDRTSNNDGPSKRSDDHYQSRSRQNKYHNTSIPSFYEVSRQQTPYSQKDSTHYLDNVPLYSSPALVPRPMPLRMDQISIQEVHVILEENAVLRNELEAMAHQFQIERHDLQRRLRHITARAQYLEQIKKSANSPEEILNEAKKPYPTSSTNSRRYLHYNMSHSNSNSRRRQQMNKSPPHNDDEGACTTSPDVLESPDDGHHHSETNNNNNNGNNNDNQKQRSNPYDHINAQRRRSFDDYHEQQRRPFYAHYDMMETSHNSPYVIPPSPYTMFFVQNKGRTKFEDDKQKRHIYMRHFYGHWPYRIGYSDEEDEEDVVVDGEGYRIGISDRDRNQMMEEEEVAAGMSDYYRNQRSRYGPPIPRSMYPHPPPPPPPGALISGPPLPHPMHPPPPMNYSHQHHQGLPPPASWMMNDLSPYPDLPHSRSSSIHRNTSTNKGNKPYPPTAEDLKEQDERMFFRLQQYQPYGDVNEEDMKMMFHQLSTNGPPPPGLMGGPSQHPGIIGAPPPPPPPPPPLMNMYGELVPPPLPFNSKYHHTSNGESSLRRVSSRRSVPGDVGNGTGATILGLGSSRSSYIG